MELSRGGVGQVGLGRWGWEGGGLGALGLRVGVWSFIGKSKSEVALASYDSKLHTSLLQQQLVQDIGTKGFDCILMTSRVKDKCEARQV